jgi:hypothetical protein
MVKRERMLAAILGVLVVALGAAIWWQLQPKAAAPAPVASASRSDVGKVEGLERIGLSRLDAKASSASAGDTDVFQIGAPSTKVVLRATPPPTLAPAPVAPEPVASPTPTPVPVMNVKYIGTVGDKKGLKVAILMTDRKEVLTGRPGEVVANRLKIVSIGLESVDVQDLGSDHVRRIPLRAN